MDQSDEKEYLQLYNANCKRCSYLDPDETKRFSSCHYSKGNEFCPAREIQIVVVGKAKRYAAQVLSARESRNAEAEAKILELVAKRSKAFIERFYFYLENIDAE